MSWPWAGPRIECGTSRNCPVITSTLDSAAHPLTKSLPSAAAGAGAGSAAFGGRLLRKFSITCMIREQDHTFCLHSSPSKAKICALLCWSLANAASKKYPHFPCAFALNVFWPAVACYQESVSNGKLVAVLETGAAWTVVSKQLHIGSVQAVGRWPH